MFASPRLLLPAVGAVCALTVAAPVFAQAPSGQAASAKPARQCFYSRNISSWTEVDDNSVVLHVNVRDRYLLKLFARCPELRWTQTIGVRNRGSDWICTDDRFDLIVQDSSRTTTQRCPVESMAPITPEAAVALTKKR